MKNLSKFLGCALFFWWLLIPFGRRVYIVADNKCGVVVGIVSVIVAIFFPILSVCLWCDALNVKGRKGQQSKTTREDKRRSSSDADAFSRNQSAYLRLLSAMIAKLAKADGRIEASEIQAAEKAFDRLGFIDIQKQLCILAFRNALNESYSIDYYASEMVGLGFSLEMRMVAYEILWEIACADGVLAAEEKIILEGMEKWLILTSGTFRHFFRQRVRQSNDEWDYDNYQRRRDSRSQQNPLANEYEELGCNDFATDEELRNAYRNLAKKLHPDVLRAQGMPESLMGKANERMARINVAWDKISKARGIRN
jgi:DnaJ like chaperone protein